MRSWAPSSIFGTNRRQSAIRIGLAIAIFATALWALPTRRAGDDGGHHGDHGATLDAFEKAGVTEFKEGQRGPALRLKAFSGETHTSLDELADRLVILNFWATWCGPCTAEMPTLEALWQHYRARGLTVVGVSVDRGAPRSLLEPYIAQLRLTFPILLDPNLDTAVAWRVTSLPATFIIKPGGEVAGVAAGAREWNSDPMRALLEPMLPPAR